ncbi:MAG TPA: hypothetical protein VFX58_08235, partial [Chitinophagaceae bacterium]|nr:hypothetical protein [Chitinophagaceae bacterium]
FITINISTMYLNITPSRLISEVQKDFNAEFPFLKIEFFKKRPVGQPEFSAAGMLPANQKIGLAQTIAVDGGIDIGPEMKVKELERIFKDRFDLKAQVFRLSGNIWLETTMTDNWSLRQQNEHGREISEGKKIKNPELPGDFDLARDADH